MTTLALVLGLLLTAPPAPSGAALNTQGFRLYQAGQYPEALAKFRAAVRADPKSALANYNAAATLGVLRKQGLVCEHEAYRETIVQFLRRAVALDKRRLARAREDADLDGIRDTVGWQQLIGRSLQKESDLPEILRAVTWSVLSDGDLSARRTLTFPDTQHAVLKTVEPDFEDEAEGKVRIRESEQRGTYTLEGRTVRLTLPGQEPMKGTLTVRGALQFEQLGTFVDNPPECDA